MDTLLSFFEYLGSNWSYLFGLLINHIAMVFLGILMALVVGVPLGIVCAKYNRLSGTILAVANVIQVFPSLAMLVLLMVVFGIGFKSVVIGLFLYSLLPIIRNTYVGLKEVDTSITEAGRGVGMTAWQLLFKVELPMSLSFLMAGLRVAAVIAVGVATLAPLIGGEGLGREIYSGINTRNDLQIYAGAILAALLAIVADFALGKLEKKF